RCVRETVAIADHELLERELWVPARRGAEGRSGLVRPALARVAVPHAVVAVSRRYELHDRAGTGHGRERLLQDAAEALCDPALRVLRGLDDQTPRAQLARAQRRQPDAVRGLPDRESELGLNLRPYVLKLGAHRQRVPAPLPKKLNRIIQAGFDQNPVARLYRRPSCRRYSCS